MAVKVVELQQNTPEWLEFRRDKGVGASESGSIIGLNEYQDIFQVFQEKVGMVEPKNTRNERTFWGKKGEPLIADSWRFYDGRYDDYGVPSYVGREEAYIKAVQEAKLSGVKVDQSKYILRDCRKAKGVVYNTKYPWLFISPDRLILPNQRKLTDGSLNPKYGYLEIKEIGYYHAKQYESGIPPEHECQVMQGMIILGVEYAELAVLSDGNRLKVIPYEYNQEYADMIIESTHNFWFGNVLPARSIYQQIKTAEMDGTPIRIIEELWGEFNQYEPEPTNEETFAKYVQKTRQIEFGKSMIGNDDMLKIARNYNAINTMKNVLDKAQLGFKNALIDVMTKMGVDEVHFDTKGWIRNRPNKNATTPVFKVSDKISPYEFKVASELAKIDFEGIYQGGDDE